MLALRFLFQRSNSDGVPIIVMRVPYALNYLLELFRLLSAGAKTIRPVVRGKIPPWAITAYRRRVRLPASRPRH